MADTISARAVAKEVRMSPRKVSLVASLVRGRSVEDALVILAHTPKRAARPVAKAIASAKANALSGASVDEKSLVIDTLTVTAGARLKRFRPVSMGRAHAFQRRTSHITVAVTGALKPKKKPAAEAKAAKETK